MEAFRLLHDNTQALSYIPVGVKEVLVQGVIPANIFIFENGRFNYIFSKGEVITKEKIQKIVQLAVPTLYISKKDYSLLKEGLEEIIRKCGRSMSMGAGAENAKRMMNLLAIHLGMVFRGPTDDVALGLHYQSVRALAIFLLDNKKLISELYFAVDKMNHYYIYSQPLTSSLMFFGLLSSTQIFSAREMEVLFIASYFKDLGLSLLPGEMLNRSDLAPQEKQLMALHPNSSSRILQGRVPLAQNYLTMIENHHIHSLLDKNVKMHNGDSIMGIETLFMSLTDMLAAMSSQRPYRDRMDLYSSLNYLKNIVCTDYPQEFRAMVQYVHKLYTDRGVATPKKAA